MLSCFLLIACAQSADAGFALKQTEFSRIQGWKSDEPSQALKAFLASCERGIAPHPKAKVTPQDWKRVCAVARSIRPEEARQFFEGYFTPYAVQNSAKAYITGYYEPLAHGSRKRGGNYQVPVYAAPKDLTPGKPYLTRKQIDAGALKNKGLEIAWLSDPVELFFLQVQGSGRIELAEGGTMPVSFAAKNNRPYTSIGKILLQRGAFEKKDASMHSIKKWLTANPEEGKKVMHQNESYIFFKLGDGPRGAHGALLTPERSLAVDPDYIPYGAPIFIDTTLAGGEPFQKLLVAQDTGSAIKGPGRADIFFGFGKEAEMRAGHLQSSYHAILLLPNAQ